MSSLSSIEASNVFHLAGFTDLDKFGVAIQNLSSQIFGSNSIYLHFDDSLREVEVGDGIALDFTNPGRPQMFLVCSYLSKMNDTNIIGERILKILTSYDNDKDYFEALLTEQLDDFADSDTILDRVFSKGKFDAREALISYLIGSPLKLIVMTDRAQESLYNVVSKINADISVLEVRAFVDSHDKEYFMFDSLYDQLDDYSSLTDSSQELIEERRKRIERRSTCDTMVVAVTEGDFSTIFMKEHRWYPIDIGPGMKNRVQYIAAYRKDSEKAITHIAKIKEIKHYKSTGRYEVIFSGEAWEIDSVVPEKIPQDVIYVRTVFGEDD